MNDIHRGNSTRYEQTTAFLPAVMDETSIESSFRAPVNVSIAPIEKLPMELLFRIIQLFIDEEAAEFFECFPSEVLNPPTSTHLALVNKKWKCVIYSSPTIWPSISLNLSQPIVQVQAKIDQFASSRRNLPVNLYISELHSHKDHGVFRTSEHTARCTVRDEKLLVSLQGIANLRSLAVQMYSSSAVPLLNSNSLPALQNLRLLKYSFLTSHGLGFSFEPLLSRMPNLVELHISDIAKMTPLNSTSPRLPNLRSLNLDSSSKVPITSLIQILSLSQNIESLFFGFIVGSPGNIQPGQEVILPRLKRLRVKNLVNIKYIFTEKIVCAPILEDYDGGEMVRGYYREWTTFSAHYPTIKKISMVAATSSWLLEDAYEAWNIQDVTLDVSDDSTGQWLSNFSYYRTLPESNLTIMMVCTNLRYFTIRTNGRRALLRTYFERFARDRCVPIDSERNTSTGCKALDELRLWVKFPEQVLVQVKESEVWKGAKITQSSAHDFLLKWSYS